MPSVAAVCAAGEREPDWCPPPHCELYITNNKSSNQRKPRPSTLTFDLEPFQTPFGPLDLQEKLEDLVVHLHHSRGEDRRHWPRHLGAKGLTEKLAGKVAERPGSGGRER